MTNVERLDEFPGALLASVLELLAECKGQQPGKPSILYYHRPHLGSNRLPAVAKAIRHKIEDFAAQLLAFYGLDGWTFGWDNARRRLGLPSCCHSTQMS